MSWRYAAGQATGSAHEKLARPCQDRFAVVTNDQRDTLIAVVADGAGTAALAHVGAEIAVSTVSSIALLGVHADRRDLLAVLREAAAVARQRLLEAATDRQAAPRDLACTLLAVVVAPLGAAALQIGDGVIVTAGMKPEWNWVFWPQKGEYANTTFFLSDERALGNAAGCELGDDIQDVALMSDGCEPLALHFATRTAHAPFFRSVFPPLQASAAVGEAADLSAGLNGMLASPAVRARTDDDTTLVLATRRPRG
ncbi:MAG TPA: PP2C family serine/threonine-protein phosphatase [Steroidobacteraceae bacterium]|nr:PP2C family serine/threonine-protein phosphatase [Steroidobacteraceae bacterium]